MFVDDREQNLAPARALGMQDDSFRRARSSLRDALAELGFDLSSADRVPATQTVVEAMETITNMQLAMIGLGRMGGNMVERLDAERTSSWSSSIAAPTSSRKYQKLGATPAKDLADRRRAS